MYIFHCILNMLNKNLRTFCCFRGLFKMRERNLVVKQTHELAICFSFVVYFIMIMKLFTCFSMKTTLYIGNLRESSL